MFLQPVASGLQAPSNNMSLGRPTTVLLKHQPLPPLLLLLPLLTDDRSAAARRRFCSRTVVDNTQTEQRYYSPV